MGFSGFVAAPKFLVATAAQRGFKKWFLFHQITKTFEHFAGWMAQMILRLVADSVGHVFFSQFHLVLFLGGG